jgi:hypothetical protein
VEVVEGAGCRRTPKPKLSCLKPQTTPDTHTHTNMVSLHKVWSGTECKHATAMNPRRREHEFDRWIHELKQSRACAQLGVVRVETALARDRTATT